MKLIYHTFLLLVMLLATLTSCTKNPLSDILGETSKDLTEKSSISDISMEADSKAAGTPMAVGSTFRLYAMAKGKTSMQDVLTTRTYTIKTTAGVPVLDEGQRELFLPIGEVDIYLVGPVIADVYDDGGTTLSKIAIATELGVFPHYGADLVASKTTVKVVAGATNKFQLNPLSHKMARMDVDVSRLPEATYENLLVREVKIYKQSLSSDFTFGEDGGSIAATTGDNDITVKGLSINEVDKGNHYVATLYMIPRPLAEMKIEVNFTCNLIGNTEKIDKRLESGLIQASLIGGKQNRFWSNPVISSTILWRTKVLPWNDVAQDDILIPQDPDLVFSYSGTDAPITINGEQYWKDRSGNGLHAKIVGDMRYDAVNMCYSNARVGLSYFQVPDLGNMDQYTLEITIQSDRDAECTAAAFSEPGVSDRSLYVLLPWAGNTVYFDTGGFSEGTNRISYGFKNSDLAGMKNFATYYFKRAISRTVTIGRNGVDYKAGGTIGIGAFKDNKLLMNTITDSSDPKLNLRLYSVRMYKTPISSAILQRHYEADLATFCGIHTKGDDSEYVQNGMLVNLNGQISSSSPSAQWDDQSGNGNHAKVYNVTYNGGYYSFDGSASKYMKLVKSLGKMQNYTIEFVTRARTDNASTVLLYASPVDVTSGPRVLNIHYPWGTAIYFDSPYNVGGMTNVRITAQPYTYTGGSLPRMPYDIKGIHQCCITREYDKDDGLTISMNGFPVASVPTFSQMLPEMRHFFIGRDGANGNYGYAGNLFAVRVYNRVLTPLERQHNYMVDQKKFGVPSL